MKRVSYKAKKKENVKVSKTYRLSSESMDGLQVVSEITGKTHTEIVEEGIQLVREKYAPHFHSEGMD